MVTSPLERPSYQMLTDPHKTCLTRHNGYIRKSNCTQAEITENVKQQWLKKKFLEHPLQTDLLSRIVLVFFPSFTQKCPPPFRIQLCHFLNKLMTPMTLSLLLIKEIIKLNTIKSLFIPTFSFSNVSHTQLPFI